MAAFAPEEGFVGQKKMLLRREWICGDPMQRLHSVNRFHACVLRLPFNQQIKNNPSFFLRIIADTASCGFSILKAKNAGVFSSATRPSALPTSEAVQWLCYHAFSVKLAGHRVIYKCLLTPLRYCKTCLFRKIPEATMQLLQKVTEPWLCEDFKAILD